MGFLFLPYSFPHSTVLNPLLEKAYVTPMAELYMAVQVFGIKHAGTPFRRARAAVPTKS